MTDDSTHASLGPTLGSEYFMAGIAKNVAVELAHLQVVVNDHAHLLRHTWAANWMKQTGADLLSLQRQGGWKRSDMIERYSHAIPIKDRSGLSNPMAESKVSA